jgi:hypothetical protein
VKRLERRMKVRYRKESCSIVMPITAGASRYWERLSVLGASNRRNREKRSAATLWRVAAWGLLGSDAVYADAVWEFRRKAAQPHLLFERAAQEAAHRVGLPAGRLLQSL